MILTALCFVGVLALYGWAWCLCVVCARASRWTYRENGEVGDGES